jgi:hypothetical protein
MKREDINVQSRDFTFFRTFTKKGLSDALPSSLWQRREDHADDFAREHRRQRGKGKSQDWRMTLGLPLSFMSEAANRTPALAVATHILQIDRL